MLDEVSIGATVCAMWGTQPKKLALLGLWITGAILLALDIGDAPVATRDFSSMWLGGRAVLAGINPYDTEAYRALGTRLLGITFPFNYTYPPHALLIAVPFALLPITVSLFAWDILTAALFYLAARPFMPKGMPSILAVLTPAAIINMGYGQYGLLTGALFLFAFRGSGLAAACLTIKPHIGFLVAVNLLRDRRGLVMAVVGTIALVAASALLFGGWADFLRHATGFQGTKVFSDPEPVWVLMNTTPMAGYGLWGWLVYAIPASVIVARNFNVFSAATATFLISPYGFHYDMTVVSLGFAILMFEQWGRLKNHERVVAVLAFASPAIVSLGTWWIPPILIAGLWVQTKFPVPSGKGDDGGQARIAEACA